MKLQRKTVWISIIALCIISCLLAGGFLWYASAGGDRNSDSKINMKMEGIRLTLANLSAAQVQADQSFRQQLKDNLGLLSLPLREIVAQDGDDAIRMYAYGCVLRRDGDRFILPPDAGAIPILEPQEYEGTMPYSPEACEPFRDREGAFWSILKGTGEEAKDEYVLCAYRQLTGDYYYLYYMPLSDVETFYQTRFDTESVLSGAEGVYDGHFVTWIEDDEGYHPFYCSSIFEGHEQPEDLGITIGKGKAGFRATTIDDVRYMYAVSAPMRVSSIGANIRIAYIIPYENYYGTTYGNSIILLVVALSFFIVLTVWVLAARKLMARGTVTQTQRRHYGARRLRAVATAVGAIGFAVILLAGMFAQGLTNLYYSTTACQSALDTLYTMQEESSVHQERMAEQRSDQYLSYALRIAALLGLYPQLKTGQQLAEMSETIGADYVMLFDDQGNETLTNAPFVNLSYGGGGSSSTRDFRRLITGVPSIVHAPCVDEVTGLNRQLIGVSMDDGDTSNGYGSLIVAVEPVTAEEGTLSLGDIMRSLASSGGVIFAVDRESRIITASSARSLVGKNVVELGLNEGNLHDGFMDFFTLEGQDRYGCSVEQGGNLFYAAVKTGSIFDGLLTDSLIPALMFLAGYALLAMILLAGYTDKKIDASGLKVMDDHDWAWREHEMAEDEEHRGWWERKTPKAKAGFALMVLIIAGSVGLIAAYSAGAMNGGLMAIIPYVLSGGWTRGFNIFALTRIVLITGGVLLILLAMKALLSVLCGILETKGETVCRLTCSLLRYVIIIVALFYALESLGFDTTTLLASLGIFSLALSLGAKDLVADVLSGIMIVFSGEYQIGDIVEIGGFRGRVWGIGVRSTTVVNKDGNMKNISNRNVSNVMNLSRLNSRFHMQIAIPYDQPLDKVKEMLARELPKISREIGDLADGPSFQGVTGLDAGYVNLGFCAECAEEDMDEVCDKVTCAIKALFEKHEIPFK